MNKVVTIWLKLEDGDNKGKIILQKRSIGKQTFPFICQGTWVGKVEDGENLVQAIIRECKEELGDIFSNNFDFSKLEVIGTDKFLMKGEEWESHNYVGLVTKTLLKSAKIHAEALPRFIFIGKNDEIYPINSEKNPKNNIVLFNEQYITLKKILNGIKGNK